MLSHPVAHRRARWTDRAFYGVICALILGVLGDATTTALAVSLGVTEADPVNRARIAHYGLGATIALYLALGIGFALLCVALWRGSFALARRWEWLAADLRWLRVVFVVMVALIAAQRLGITVWNISVLTRVLPGL